MDRKRIRRIVLSIGTRGVATIWLALAIAGCSTTGPAKSYYPYTFDRDRAKTVKRVAVAPMNLLTPALPYVGPKAAAVHASLTAYVNSRGLVAESVQEAGRVWEEEKRRAGGIYSGQTGRIDNEKFRRAMRNTISRICRDSSADAVLFAELVERTAIMQESTVYWDGAEERIGIATLQGDRAIHLISGNKQALSLSIVVVGSDGRLLLKNIAGDISCDERIARGAVLTEPQ